MGPLSWQELIFIFLLALLIFGPKKLPELGKTIGKAMTEFRRASSELKSTFDREMNTLERDTELKEVASSVNRAVDTYNYDTYAYDSGSYDSFGESNGQTASEPSTASASAPEGAQLTSTPATTGDNAAAASDSVAAVAEAAPPAGENTVPKVVPS
ncbi:MAG: twin-arginine translocase TatA/TatE family subunit [Bryobacteraceae bacterium]